MAIRFLEVRRHAVTKKGVERGHGSHLSADGVALARAVGDRIGPVDRVVVGPLPRHLETALAMGYAVDEVVEWPSGYVPGVVDHHDQWRWPEPFTRYAELVRGSPALAEVAATHRQTWTEAVRAAPAGGTALVVSSGGAMEPALVACLPDAGAAGWGPPFGHCDGARLAYSDADGRFISASIVRATDRPDAVLPPAVATATDRAAALGFTCSCEEPVGPLLATLAAAVPSGGRILELGTGAGVGTAWLVAGVGDRQDVSLTTVEVDAALAATVRAAGWPPWVQLVSADAEVALSELGRFDLIFADAVAGKWTGLHLTLDALAPGGTLVVDDMDLRRYPDPAHRAAVTRVEEALAADHRLTSVRLATGSGITLATRHR